MSTLPTNDAAGGKYVSGGDDFLQFVSKSGQFLGWINSSGELQGALQTIGLSCGAAMQNPKYIGTGGAAISTSGSNNIYTVPSGRRAVILSGMIANNTTTATTAYTEVNKGGLGTYYSLNSSVTTGAGHALTAFSTTSITQYAIILEAGDILSINLSGANQHFYYGNIVEFDATSNFKSAWLLNPIGGGAVTPIYTVPAGKTAQILSNFVFDESSIATAGAYGTALTFQNLTSGTVTYQIVYTPSGGTAQTFSPTGQTISAAAAGAAPILVTGFAKMTMSAGDSIGINTSYAGTTSPFYMWMNLIEN
jgi:hypothetical protein